MMIVGNVSNVVCSYEFLSEISCLKNGDYLKNFDNPDYMFGCQISEFPLVRVRNYLIRLWLKKFKMDYKIGSILFREDFLTGWHRDKGTGKNVMLVSLTNGSWVRFENGDFVVLKAGDILVFNGKRKHKGFVSMGFVMFESKNSDFD